MMVFTWNRGTFNAKPYPVLHYTSLPVKGEGEPDTLRRILQTHVLTVEEQNDLDKIKDGEKVEYLAKKFPYVPKSAVDTAGPHYNLLDAIDTACDAVNEKFRQSDGQHKHIKDKWL